MGLKNDWSGAYYLYYSAIIGCCFIAVGAIVNSVPVFNTRAEIHLKIQGVPVFLESQKEIADQEFQMGNVKLDISDRLKTTVEFQSTDESSANIIFDIYLLKLLRYAILFIIFFLFSRILKNVAKEKPFHERNATYLFASGWILTLTPFMFFFSQRLIPFPIKEISYSDAFSSISLNFVEPYFFYAGVAIFVLGYVFKEGARLYQEQKLTV